MKELHQLGDIVGNRYRVGTCLGRGGMGITYAAENVSNGRRVAIKVLSLRQISGWRVLELFEREARVLQTLNHPAIPQYLDYLQIDTADDRRFYLVQELAQGKSLATLVEQGWHATEEEVQHIGMRVLEILNYLHRLAPPVIHRDIKPQNIILGSDGQVFLVDFGAVQDAYRNMLTAGNTFVGTFGYVPPEQFRGQVFFASDLYGLGATLLFLLTRRSPADLPQKRMKIDFRRQVQLSTEFATWLDKMLEPNVEDRFQSAPQALNALSGKQVIVSASIAQPQPPVSRKQKRVGSRVTLQRTNDCLTVKSSSNGKVTIGDVGYCGVGLLVVGFGVLPFTFLFIQALESFSTAPSSMTVIVLIITVTVISMFGCICLLILSRILYAISGSMYVEINREVFHIARGWLGVHRRYRGWTANLSVGKKYEECALRERSGKKHYFDRSITREEQEWLIAEISDFLKQLSPQGNKGY